MSTPPLVLLVDAFDDARDMYGEYLTANGYRAVLAADGATGIQYAVRLVPDVILLDMGMRGMSGVETLRALRTDPTLVNAAIVALASPAFDKDRERILAQGFDEVVSKPCDPADMVSLISRLVASPRHRT